MKRVAVLIGLIAVGIGLWRISNYRSASRTESPSETTEARQARPQPLASQTIQQLPADAQSLENMDLPALLTKIRNLQPGLEKDKALTTLLSLHTTPYSRILLDSLATETDPILRDHEKLLLAQIIDAESVQRLLELMDAAKQKPEIQNLYLDVIAYMSSPPGLDALQSVARSSDFSITEPFLFLSLRSLARSGRPEDVRSIFDCVERHPSPSRNEFGILVTAAVEIANEDSKALVMTIAQGTANYKGASSQLIGIYSLRKYRDAPEVRNLLIQLRGSNKPYIAAAAEEALSAPL